MTAAIFKKLKRANGESFAQAVRKHAPAALEYEATLTVLKHAGRDPDDVPKIAAALHAIVTPGKSEKVVTECPLSLLDKAGYDAYFVTDQSSQDAIKKYFAADEKLCTFGTPRWKSYKIINAVRKDVDTIKRSANPKREDDYGTSVLSIQVRNGFVSIKNRYNHKVANCDATFGNDLDAIIPGLRSSIENHFKIKIGKGRAPNGFMIAGRQLFKVNCEINGIYYGEHGILTKGNIVEMEKGRESLYEYFVFDNATKTMRLFDDTIKDSFAEDFNRHYGGLKTLRVDKKGNLFDGNTLVIGVEA